MDIEKQLLKAFGDIIDPAGYIERIWQKPFPWQEEALQPHKRMILDCARQSGKSTIVSGIALNKAKYKMNSLNLIISPSEKQSKETIKKVEEFIQADEDLSRLSMKADSTFEKRFKNGSRVIALSGSEKGARGYSKPDTIIIDEAARVSDETYRAVRPMLTGNPDAQLILLSTPWIKSGFFYEEWTKSPVWKKILVVPRWHLDDNDMLVERGTEEEFRAEWAKKGVDAFYSPRHTIDFLYEELQSIGPIWFRREYACEFVEGLESMFSMDLIDSAIDTSLKVEDDLSDDFTDNVEVDEELRGLF